MTVFAGVPTTWATLLGLEQVGDYPCVRCVTNAAAGLPPHFHDGLRRLFPNAAIFRMYGLTECKRVCYLEPELVDVKPTSVGRAIPGTEAFVLDERPESRARRGRDPPRARSPLDARLLARPRADRAHAEDGPFRARRCSAPTTTSPSTRTGSLLRRSNRRHHQDTRREGELGRGRERAARDPRNRDGRRCWGARRRPRPVRARLRRARGGLDAHRAGDHPACTLEIGELHGSVEICLVPELPQTESGKVRKKSLLWP